MNWAANQRQRYIESRRGDPGHVNRNDLCREFGISIQQASIDIQAFLRLNVGRLIYNRSTKRYEAINQGTFHCPVCMRDTPHTHNMDRRWIGVDFDGTLSRDRFGRDNPYEVGEPIPAMVERVKGWLAAGYDVRIMTARAHEFSFTGNAKRDLSRMRRILADWCAKHLGKELPITNVKDGAMEVLWDDRAVRVVRDTGQPAEFRTVSSAGAP